MTRTAVITIVAGRHQHLLGQQRGIRAGRQLPDDYVVVAMDDPEALRRTAEGPLAGTTTRIHQVLLPPAGRLPLAQARNAGAAAAVAAGAEILIFLDVDCVPSAELIGRYRQTVTADPAGLHCGVVRYLDPDISPTDPAALTSPPHPARPVPAAGAVITSAEWQLFWSLSFAVSADQWSRLGGFCEDYRGYGAEDTDLGYRAYRTNTPIHWIGGADAFHQYHDVERPPIRHLSDIVDNATVFHQRWGFWPMLGWLTAFADLGLARYDDDRDSWSLTTAGANLTATVPTG